MKRNSRLSAAISAGILLFSQVCAYTAPEAERPEPGSAKVPAQKEGTEKTAPSEQATEEKEPKGEKVGFLRAWDYAYLKDVPGLAIVLGPAGKPPPSAEERLWVKRGMTAPDTRNWFEVPAGKYDIYVLADDATAGNAGTKISSEGSLPPSLLSKRVEVNVTPGSYQTILLSQEGSKVAAEVLNDGAIGAAGPVLRVFKFATDVQPSISLLRGRRSTELVPKLAQNRSEVNVAPGSGTVSYQMSYPLRRDFVSRQNIEVDHRGFRSCSIIVAPDRYGRLSVFAVTDAPNNPPAAESR